jgi:hypothetical protein
VLAVDGTKVHANASHHANRDYEQLARESLEEAKAIDAAEDELYEWDARRRSAQRQAELKSMYGEDGYEMATSTPSQTITDASKVQHLRASQ